MQVRERERERTLQLSQRPELKPEGGKSGKRRRPVLLERKITGHGVFNYRSRLILSTTTADWIDRASIEPLGNPWGHNGSTTWNAVNHRLHGSVYWPFSDGWPEHAFRDAVSTYSQ